MDTKKPGATYVTFQTRLITSISVILILAFIGLEYATYRHAIQTGLNNLQQQAEGIRAIIMSMSRVYHHQFLDSEIELTERTVGFLPAHALNRISREFPQWSDTEIRFNNVSNRPRNPLQKADAVEREAIRYFEEHSNQEILFKPFTDQDDNPFYLYARPIWVESYCLNCHGKREEAPVTIQNLYDTAFDYQAGELHGILSIKLPATEIKKKALSHLHKHLLLHTIGLIILIIAVVILVRRYLSNPLTEITEGMKSVTADQYNHDISALKGEFSEPARIFNEMTHKITEQRNELNNMVETLDQRVKERTLELNARIDELTRTRNELIQSEKMASLGRLVAGFAHEINTPIGVAHSAASYLDENVRCLHQLMERDEVSEEELLECLDPMEESARLVQSNINRASRLVSSFKRTAIDQSNEELRLFNLHEAIDDVINTLHNKFKRTSITTRVECPEALSIYGNPGQVEQLLTNLMMNSLIHGFDNGNKGGEITIVVARTEQNLELTYSDNGDGMEEALMEHVFEPFFTTNRIHGGSGLGLYICYNLVVTQLKGTIQCNSKPGQGIQFSIEFPIQDQEGTSTR